MKKAAIGAITLAWGLLVFLVALHVHFPGDAAIARAKWEVQNATDGAWAVDASAANLWRLSGVGIEDLVVYRVDPTSRRGGEEDDPADAVPFMRAENVRARVALLPLLMGTREVEFDADVYGGNVNGSVGEGAESRRVVLEGEALDLSRVPLEGEDWNIDATGLARIAADLTLDAEDIKASEGTFNLAIDDLAIVSAKAMGIDLTPASFSEAVLDVVLEKGKAEIESGRFISDLISVEMDGNITLSKRQWDRWRMKVGLKVKLGEELDSMAKFLPTFKNARGNDDQYHFSCSGTLGRPRCKEDRSVPGVTGSRSTKSSLSRSKDKDLGKRRSSRPSRLKKDRGEDRDAPDRAEARERRLERIRERRERLRERREARAAERVDEGMDNLEPPVLDGPVGLADPMRRFDDGGDFEDALGDPDGDGMPGFDPPNEFRPSADDDAPLGFEGHMDDYEDPNY